LGESDSDKDSSGVLYSKLKRQLEQRHSYAFDQASARTIYLPMPSRYLMLNDVKASGATIRIH